MSSDRTVHRYQRRLVNPFRGAVAVVETAGARAHSRDGLHWQLEALAAPPHDLWAGTDQQQRRRYFAFGHWNADRGLHRVPLSPLLESHGMVRAVETLLLALQATAHRLPFPFVDRWELWLLDAMTRKPLYLAATGSTAPTGEAAAPMVIHRGADAATQEITTQIDAHWGNRRLREWRLRDTWPGAGLPPLPVNLRDASSLVPRARKRYLEHWAPALLTLPTLTTDFREELEGLAAKRPLEVARHRRLYPCILDPSLSQAAQVAERLDRSE